MRITCHNDFTGLEAHRNGWNALARGVPFRTWEWLETWWRHYANPAEGKTRRELFLLAAWDEQGGLSGIAPWYKSISRSGTRYVRFLGDGEVCTDYLSILCRPSDSDRVPQAIAQWLMSDADESHASSRHRWDVLDLTGVDAEDVALAGLLSHLRELGNTLHYTTALQSWRIMMPASWESYVKMLSKQQRNRVRRWDREYLRCLRAIVHSSSNADEIEPAFDILVDLHQRRWQQRGLPGSFSSRPFHAFHREAVKRLAARGQARILWIELDGTPLAADYHLIGDGVIYAYQAGIDPVRLEVNPGQLATIASLKDAVERGMWAYDFLRGDEPYKSQWHAKPRPMLSVRVIPPRASAWFRHHAWLAGQNLKHWVKQGLRKSCRPKPFGRQNELSATPPQN